MADTSVQVLASHIKQLREDRSTTLGSLARESGVDAIRLRSIEQGETEVTLLEVEQLAAALEVPVHCLFT